MSEPLVIPPGARINGFIIHDGDLIIEGRVTGEIEISGVLTVTVGGQCQGIVYAHTAHIRGRVNGAVTCTESIFVEAGAQVIGDLESPFVDVYADVQVLGDIRRTAAPAPRLPVGRRRVRLVGPSLRSPVPPPRGALGSGEAAGGHWERPIPLPPRPRGRVRVVARGTRRREDAMRAP